MSYSSFYTYDDQLEDHQDSENSWMAGDLHITELGYSLDILAMQNEPLDEYLLSPSYENTYYNVPESIGILPDEIDSLYIEQMIQNHEPNFPAPTSFSSDARLEQRRDDFMLPLTAHMDVQYCEQLLEPSQRAQGSLLSSSNMTRDVTEMVRLHSVASPSSHPQMSQFATEIEINTEKKFHCFAQGHDHVPTHAYDSSRTGQLDPSFHRLNSTGSPSYHLELMETSNDSRAYYSIPEWILHEQTTAQPVLNQPRNNPGCHRTNQEQPVNMERSQSAQTLGFVPWGDTEMSRSLSSEPTSFRLLSVACTICGQRFRGKHRKRNLQRHRQSKHDENGSTKHVCQVPGCDHKYQRSDALRVHERKAHLEST